jgi:hypothetical protein
VGGKGQGQVGGGLLVGDFVPPRGRSEEETKSNEEGSGYSAASSSNPMKPPDCRAQNRA